MNTITPPLKNISDLPIKTKSPLNHLYSFDNFMVSSSNQLAYLTAQSIIDNKENLYNLSIIIGKNGLGKTHLVQALGNDFQEKGKTVTYSTAERFLNEYIILPQ